MRHGFVDFRSIKEYADFSTVLAHYGLTAQGGGNRRMVLCPFHEDRRPSLSVRLDRKRFHCFGCGARGDTLDFVRRMEPTHNIRAAAEQVAAICGAPATALGEVRQGRKEHRQGGFAGPAPCSAADASKGGDACGAANKPHPSVNRPLSFRLRLDPDHPYLRARGIDPGLARRFGLGYCGYGRFRGRIAIPIHDERERIVAYAGRWAGGDEELPEGQGKYKLPAGFLKSQALYNLHRVAGAEHVVLVEGYFGTIRLHALGVAAVALMGRTIAEPQTRLLLASGAKRLTLLLDGDAAGRAAAAEMLPALARPFFVRVADLPDGLEPDTADEAELRKLLSS